VVDAVPPEQVEPAPEPGDLALGDEPARVAEDQIGDPRRLARVSGMP
jgi:hypothetical protein